MLTCLQLILQLLRFSHTSGIPATFLYEFLAVCVTFPTDIHDLVTLKTLVKPYKI